MKRFLALLVCLVLMVSAACAAADYTLPEKMQKQLLSGSGLKGFFTLHAEGKSQLALSLEPFQDVEMQVRGIQNWDQMHAFMYQEVDENTLKGLTEVYKNGDKLYFRSDLLPGKIYFLSDMMSVAERILQQTNSPLPFSGLLYRLMSEYAGKGQGDGWSAFLQKYENQIEIWMGSFAQEITVGKAEDDTSVMEADYLIPMSAAQDEIISILRQISQQEDERKLFQEILTEEEAEIFFNPNLGYYFKEAMQAMDSQYDIIISRTMSMMGDPISTSIECPLDTRIFGYSSLTVESDPQNVSVTVKNEEYQLTVIVNEPEKKAYLIRRPADPANKEAEWYCIRISGTETSETTMDENDVTYETRIIHWTAETDTSVLPEEENRNDYPPMTPVQLDLEMNYHSKYAQSSPTTMDFRGSLVMEDLNLKVEGQLKTAKPWDLMPFETAGAVDFLSLSDDDMLTCLAEWLASAREQIVLPQEESAGEGGL